MNFRQTRKCITFTFGNLLVTQHHVGNNTTPNAPMIKDIASEQKHNSIYDKRFWLSLLRYELHSFMNVKLFCFTLIVGIHITSSCITFVPIQLTFLRSLNIEFIYCNSTVVFLLLRLCMFLGMTRLRVNRLMHEPSSVAIPADKTDD